MAALAIDSKKRGIFSVISRESDVPGNLSSGQKSISNKTSGRVMAVGFDIRLMAKSNAKSA